MSGSSDGVVVLWTADARVVRAVEALAAGAGLEVRRAGEGASDSGPSVVVVDLDGPGALETVGEIRARWPEALVAGHLGLPDQDRWLAAERAGCDVVANRGALAASLRRRLASGTLRRAARQPLFAVADAAGRLGCVHREPADGERGPVAVYHQGNRFSACADRCPHSGARLSEGEFLGGVVTCPRHGSQFDVSTGERLRGPADVDIATFAVEEAGGRVYLLRTDAGR